MQSLGEALYRYNTLKEQNFIDEAQNEKENIENIVLKSGISYNKYVWHSENGEHTCDTCKELDGKVFDFYDEVPERPHPNCKCYVEIVENNNSQNDQNGNKVIPKETGTQPNTQSQQKKWIMPCDGPISSGYGTRIHPVYKTEKFHNGWDISVPVGTPINAIADGKILYAGAASGYGNMVLIDHGVINGTVVTSEYGHISEAEVKIGDIVKQGQVIAKSGNEGVSSGPHVHITIREGVYKGKPVDPADYIDF